VVTLARAVRVISGWTIGGGGRVRELFPLSPWLIIAGRVLRWFVVHWRVTIELAGFATLWWYTRSVAVAGAILAGTNLVLAAVSIAVVLRLSGASVVAIITGMSRRRKVARLWPRAARAAKLVEPAMRGLEPRLARLGRARVTPAGVRATCRVGEVGKTVEHTARERQTLAAVMGCREVYIRKGKHPGLAILDFVWGDPLLKTIRLKDLPPIETSDRLIAGLTEAGQPIHVGLDTSLLVVGLTGSGKSSQIWALLASLIATRVPFRLTVIDPKGGMELGALRHSHFTKYYATMPEEIAQVLHDSVDDMRQRAQQLAAKRIRKVVYSQQFPLEVLLVDEFLALTSFMNGNLRQRVERDLGLLITQGRAAGFTGIFATQGSQVDALGRVRTFITQRICLATDSIETTVAALGDKARHVARCDQITQSQRGVGYMQDDDARLLVRYRGAYVTDHETEILARGELPRKAFTGAQVVTLSSLGKRRRARRRDADEVERVGVYRWVGVDDEVLYIGISNDPDRRIGEHVDGKPWVTEAVRVDIVGWYDSREEALQVEEDAIKTEHPRYNIIHNGEVIHADDDTLSLELDAG
jgi:predicted GIY-YIG superfamily endonuclease